MTLYAHTVVPGRTEQHGYRRLPSRGGICPSTSSCLKRRVRCQVVKIPALDRLHRLPSLRTKGGTGLVGAAAYTAGDTLSVPSRVDAVTCQTSHPSMVNAFGLRFAFMIPAGLDARKISKDGVAQAQRIDDVFGEQYHKGNVRQANAQVVTGALAVPEKITTAMAMRSRLATACSYVSLLGFLGLFGYFVKGFGLYAKKGLEFRAAFPKNEPLHKQMAFLYDQVLLSEADISEAMRNSIHNPNGAMLAEDEVAILMDHEKKMIRREVKEKRSYQALGRSILSEDEEESLILLLQSEAAKIKHRKEAEYTRAVGPESLIAVKQYIELDFFMQKEELRQKEVLLQKGKKPHTGQHSLGCGFLKQLENPGAREKAAAKTIIDKAVKENRNNTAINTFVTVISILGVMAVIPLLVLKLALVDAWLWLIVGVAMLVVDLYFLGYALLTQSPNKKEQLAMLVMNLFAVSLGIAAFFMGAPLLGWIALSLQLVLAGYMLYQYRQKQLPAHFR